MKHTPTPWHLDNEGQTVVGADGIQICTPHGLRHPQPAANAAFIVRAVNAHDELLALTKELTVVAKDSYSPLGETLTALIYRAEQAIARAEGR